MKTKKVRFYIGLDVHTKFTAYAVRDSYGTVVSEGSCSSTAKDILSILEPYMFSSRIGLECNTEVYPIYDAFKEEGYDIRVANTIQLRTLIGKNDKLDAKRLSDMLRLGTFPQAYIPKHEIRALRGIVKVRHSIMEESVRVQNQIKAVVRKNGLRVPTNDIGKKYVATLQQYLAANPQCRDLMYLLEHYCSVMQRLQKVTNEMIGFAKKHFQKEFDALIKKEGIADITASYFISEICPVTRFASPKKLRRYAGIVPCSEISGGKTYATFLPKTTSRGLLRWAFVQAANRMSRFDENMKAYYKKKKKEKKIHGKAIIAVSSSISDIVYKTLYACQEA